MDLQPADVAFTSAVRAAQSHKGSAEIYADIVMPNALDDELMQFIAGVRSFYLGTASAAGQPYIQHRGGPPGFLKPLDARTLGFADFRGNRQYITTGNLSENPRAFLFLMDYYHRIRIKIWGRAVVENDPDLIAALLPEAYPARAEQAIRFHIDAWDSNCPQHIPQMFFSFQVAGLLAARDSRIAELEAQLQSLHERQQSVAAYSPSTSQERD